MNARFFTAAAAAALTLSSLAAPQAEAQQAAAQQAGPRGGAHQGEASGDIGHEGVTWSFRAEQIELRAGEHENLGAWDASAFVGTDELRLVLRSEAEYSYGENAFETLEHQARLQMPISTFFDAVAGVRLDTPEHGPTRVYGVVGVHGLAPQWFEVDVDLYLAEKPTFRTEIEYEALITNRLILTPSVEVDLPLADDARIGAGAFGPTVELGARLSYDVVDRLISPYVGVHYERTFGESAAMARAEDKNVEQLFGVVGVKVLY